MESLQNVNSSSSNVYDFEMIRDVVFRYLSKWYLFVLSVIICLTIVFVYFKSTNDKYQTQTTILLRKDKGPGGLADLSMLDGLTSIMPNGVNSKEVEDEIQILSSKTLMYNAIINLNLYTEYYQKVGLRYEELFPTSPIRLICPPLFNDTTKDPSVEFNLSSKEGKYLLEIKSKKFTKEYSIDYLS